MEAKKDKNLQWGEHHSGDKGTVKNKDGKLITDTNELLASTNAPIDLSEQEPGRNREGVREGENKLEKDAQKKSKH